MTVEISRDTLTSLEFDKIIDIISRYARSEGGYEKIKGIRCCQSREEAERELRKLVQYKKLAEELKIVPDLSHKKFDEILKRAAKEGSYLSGEELSVLLKLLEAFKLFKSAILPYYSEFPDIASPIKATPVPHNLIDEITNSIDRNGELKPEASEKLSEVNAEIHEIRNLIEDNLERYIKNRKVREYLQEIVITMRDNRYVLPLKHNFKGKIPGVVHSYSGSGETVFVEPFSIVELNNRLKILEKQKEREVKKILQRITSLVRDKLDVIHLIHDIMADLDVSAAKYEFLKNYSCTIPEFVKPREIRIYGARHPLIKGEVVPVDIVLEDRFSGMVITGPNTGGKTVCLKTTGLFILMAQSGIPVPAERMETYFFRKIFTDIGDESSIEQSLSTFASHMNNIKTILDRADRDSLVLIDELGAGTDPAEGGAIGTALLEYITERGIKFLVTTHFNIIKKFAIEHPKVQIASVLFDSRTLKPLYRLVIGIPGRSNALEIALNIGIRNEIISGARNLLGEEAVEFDKAVKDIGEKQVEIQKVYEELKNEKKIVEELRKSYEEKLNQINEYRGMLRSKLEKEYAEFLSDYRKKLDGFIGELKEKTRENREARRKLEESFGEAKREIEEYLARKLEFIEQDQVKETEEIKEGDEVVVRIGYGKSIRGVVEDLGEKKALVRTPKFSIEVDVKNLRKVGSESELSFLREKTDHDTLSYEVDTGEASWECDVRGLRLDEAVSRVKSFIERAFVRGLTSVKIIHGMGTGVLRNGIMDFLKNNPLVESCSYERAELGGYGCTVVKLKI